MKIRWNDRGSTVALAVAVALAAAILIASATRSLLFSSHQVVYFNAMNRAYRLAETGLVEAMGRLAVDPGFYVSTPSMVTDVDVPGEGVYSVNITTRADVVASGYYFVTTASVTIANKTYGTRLHTHLRISNAADYFWACNQTLLLAQGTDASGGKVYAPYLEFIIDTDVSKPATKVFKAEFMNSITPALNSGYYGALNSNNRVEVITPDQNNNYRPIQVSAVVFPQVLDSDMLNYYRLADNGAFSDCDIQGAAYNNLLNVYPPGYYGSDLGGADADPFVLSKSTENKHHVWYCPGDLQIGNIRVYGQVVFAAKGNVNITGSIISDSNPVGSSYFPGAGSDPTVNRASSTAHQAVIVTQKGVTVKKGFHPGTANLQLTERIECMILAPHGKLTGENYGVAPNWTSPIHGWLSLNIRGSLIVGQVENEWPHNFYSIFQGVPTNGDPPRLYTYMPSLKTSPPFYMPALAEIYFSYEESFGTWSIF